MLYNYRHWGGRRCGNISKILRGGYKLFVPGLGDPKNYVSIEFVWRFRQKLQTTRKLSYDSSFLIIIRLKGLLIFWEDSLGMHDVEVGVPLIINRPKHELFSSILSYMKLIDLMLNGDMS